MSDTYRLTDPQHAMLADSINDPGQGLWNVQLTFTMGGPLDVERFQRAWERVIERHTALRTRFAFSGNAAPFQVVEERVPVSFETVDVTEAEVEAFRKRAVLSQLDFSVAPVMRLILLRLRADLHVCIWVGHHSLVDGRSMFNLAKELGAIYHAQVGEAALPPVRPFREYVDWQAQHALGETRAYWRDLLQGVNHATALGWTPPAGQTGHLGSEALRLSRAHTDALRTFCEQSRVTLNAVLQSAWALVLARYSGDDDVVFGSTRNCRRSALGGVDGVEQMIGQFVHAVPVRVRLAPSMTVTDLIREVARQHLAVRPYEHDSPLAIRSATKLPIGSRLFDTVVTFERSSIPAAIKFLERVWTSWDVLDRGRNAYAVSLFGYDETELLLRLEWHGGWLQDAVASRVLRNLAHTLAMIMEAPGRLVQEVDCLAREELERLDGWNHTAVPYPRGATLHQLIEDQTKSTPHQPALRFEDQVLTYQELDGRANALAAVLHKRGVGRGSVVGVCLERSVELVVSLLAVLKAGGAYLPLDPEYPAERIRFVLEDAAVGVLITTEASSQHLAGSPAELLLVGSDRDAGAAIEFENPGVTESDPAYVIYTSGTTGKPKGAINTHRAVINNLRWMQDTYRLSSADRVLQKTPFSFDVSVWDLFWPLLAGAELVVARPGGHRDATYLKGVIEQSRITVMVFVPSMLTEFLGETGVGSCGTLRLVLCIGEALPVDVQNRFLTTLNARLDNLYGPTEAAIGVSSWQCRKDDPGQTTVPIGRPIANTRFHVLDQRQRPRPIGMAGELFIGGVQVAEGYLNRPDLTARHFVPDIFTADVAARLYRTGDLVRYREDGVLEFLGRADDQVKLRGFRIELEEIEAALRAHPSIHEAVVVVQQTGGEPARLAASVVFDGGEIPTTTEIRQFLRRWLPDHMIPSVVVGVNQLPRLTNGKVDRRALTEGAKGTDHQGKVPVELRTECEKTIATLWRSQLRVSKVGPRDNFFELGGDSLGAVQAVLAMEDALGCRIEPRLMFFQTLEQIAAGMEALLAKRANPEVTAVVVG